MNALEESDAAWRAAEAEHQRPRGLDEQQGRWDHPIDPWHPMDLSRLQGLEIPKRRFVITPWVPMIETTGLGGSGGDGKTLLAQMLATSAALGAPWLGIDTAQMKSIVLLCEDRAIDAWIRQDNINRL